MPGRADPDLAELRTVVARAHEQIGQLTREARAGRAALRAERAQLRATRERLEQLARDAFRNGQLGPRERALMARIESGATSWRAVSSGTDDHWTAVGLRADLGDQVQERLAQLREHDPGFLREHDAALRSARDSATRAPW